MVTQYADSAVIYTHDVLGILQITQYDDAWQDIYGFDDLASGADSFSDIATRVAFHAYEAELNEAIDNILGGDEVERNPSHRMPKRGKHSVRRKKSTKKRSTKKRSSKGRKRNA